MIPAHPEFVEKSYEDLIFDALKNYQTIVLCFTH